MLARPLLLALLVLAAALAGCAQGPPAPATPRESVACDSDRLDLDPARADTVPAGKVTLLTHDSFTMSTSLLSDFRNETGLELEIVKLGDAGEALNKAILQKEAPIGDALFGVDDNLIHRARANDLFQPYVPVGAGDIPMRFLEPFCSGATLHATPVDYGYVMLNHDPAWFEQNGLAPPATLEDLAKPDHARLTVVQNPYTSSPGLAFLLATVAHFGTDDEYDYQDFWRGYVENGGKVTSGWEQAYGSEFTQGWDEAGALDRPIVLSYSTSPAYNPMMGYSENATSANLDLEGAAWLQVESVGILKNAKNPEGARALIDFLVSKRFQEEVPFLFATYPVVANVTVPEAYDLYAPEPERPMTLPAAEIEANRNEWLAGWREATGQA